MKTSGGAARVFLVIGCVFGLLSVAAGAFGAHGLRTIVPAQALVNFETAARYQMYHALVLVAIGLAWHRMPGRWLVAAGTAFTLGVTLFCGSLYAYVLGAPRSIAMVAPVGGIALMVGWLALAVAAFTARRPADASARESP